MKVAYFILNNFDFDSRARLEVETLVSMGHRVEIIATVGAASSTYLGSPIHRLPQWRGPTKKFRFAQYNLLAAMAGVRSGAHIYHAVDLDALLPAVWAAWRNGGRVIYEARELYTELEALSGRAAVKKTWERLERRLIGKAEKVITINDSIAGELCRRYGIASPTVVRNVAPLPGKLEARDLRKIFDIPSDWKVLIYQGVLRAGQGLAYLIEIMARLEKAALLFVGDGPLRGELSQKSERLGLSHKVRFAGRVPPDELLSYTTGADAGLLLMEDVALNNRLALPQKLFQYLVAGIPQIVSPMPEIAGFAERAGTGIVVPLGNAGEAAAKIAAFLCDDGKLVRVKASCREASKEHNWQVESKKLRAVYEDLEVGR